MSKFNNGDAVFLARHADDSSVNLEIGYEGVVLDGRAVESRTLVHWKQDKGYSDTWYVDTDTLEYVDINLENE